uniref:Uncharacterized protein n=1 Tax=viral metagenome TaxID=1070528 RepID=A0A6M3M0R2_9ZZZZ
MTTKQIAEITINDGINGPRPIVVMCPSDYDPSIIDAFDVNNDWMIQTIPREVEAEALLAAQIVGQMSNDDRLSYCRDSWRDGVSNNCLNGEHLETVLDYIDEIV